MTYACSPGSTAAAVRSNRPLFYMHVLNLCSPGCSAVAFYCGRKNGGGCLKSICVEIEAEIFLWRDISSNQHRPQRQVGGFALF